MSETLEYLLAPIRAWMDEPGVEELCLAPGLCFVWKNGRFERREVGLDADDLMDIAIVAGAQRRLDAGRHMPLLETNLPGGRLYAVLPPCAAEPSLTIRIGSSFEPTIDGLAEDGLFERVKPRPEKHLPVDAELRELHRAQDWRQFFSLAARARKTIVAAGRVGSGKTTFLKGLIAAIPSDERIVTVEDTAEWNDRLHENKVALFYAGGGQDGLGITPALLVRASLRMRPERVLLQELRDGASVLAFLHALQAGYPGGLTSIHATSTEGVFGRMRMLIKQEPAGAAAKDKDIDAQLRSLIDIVVHCERDAERFWLSDVLLVDGSTQAVAA